MFVNAIERVAKFTRPIHTIRRNYASSVVHPGAATLFIVNSNGWALTCAHVANQLGLEKQLLNKYKAFKDELASRYGERKERQLRKELERTGKIQPWGIVDEKAGSDMDKLRREILDDFSRIYPGFKVQFQAKAWDEAHKRLWGRGRVIEVPDPKASKNRKLK